MLFMITYEFGSDVRDETQTRFKKTGGMPGPGVTMKGRWHCVGELNGFILAESSDAVALGKWLQEWTDLIMFTVSPVVDDEDVMKVLGA